MSGCRLLGLGAPLARRGPLGPSCPRADDAWPKAAALRLPLQRCRSAASGGSSLERLGLACAAPEKTVGACSWGAPWGAPLGAPCLLAPRLGPLAAAFTAAGPDLQGLARRNWHSVASSLQRAAAGAPGPGPEAPAAAVSPQPQQQPAADSSSAGGAPEDVAAAAAEPAEGSYARELLEHIQDVVGRQTEQQTLRRMQQSPSLLLQLGGPGFESGVLQSGLGGWVSASVSDGTRC